MKKFEVELKFTYTVEAETENDAIDLINGMRYDNFLPVGYWAEEEEIEEANRRYDDHLGGDRITQSKLISRDGDYTYCNEVEE